MTDTIVALSTAPVSAAIGVVRVSGPAVSFVIQRLIGQALNPRVAHLANFSNSSGQRIDQGLALYFAAPHSYTGEDVLELQGHGGVAVMQSVLRACLECDEPGRPVRLAQPGEFTRRAFLNQKIDLVQVEAVADLISASSQKAAVAAMASLTGKFSQELKVLQDALTDLRCRVEACLDFPEEDIDFISEQQVAKRLEEIDQKLIYVLSSAQRGAALREGLKIVLVGAPNVGKSSLLNALSEQEVAIVTPEPGTTRDRIVQAIVIDGITMQVIDTAGWRTTENVIEKMGIERSWQSVDEADLVLLIADATGEVSLPWAFEQALEDRINIKRLDQERKTGVHVKAPSVWRLWNKVDLVASNLEKDSRGKLHQGRQYWVSAKTGAGLSLLREGLKREAGWEDSEEGTVFGARTRHIDALRRTADALNSSKEHLRDAALELLAEQLRLAQRHLSEITGEIVADDLLGSIFSQFCIGK